MLLDVLSFSDHTPQSGRLARGLLLFRKVVQEARGTGNGCWPMLNTLYKILCQLPILSASKGLCLGSVDSCSELCLKAKGLDGLYEPMNTFNSGMGPNFCFIH